MNLNDGIRYVVSRPALQPLWSKLLKLCHAGMNYGGGQAVRNSGELSALALLAQRFSPHEEVVIFDVGANDGEYAEAASRVFQQHRRRIFCFEPQRSSFLNLQGRFEHDPWMYPKPIAIGRECGTVNLFSSPNRQSTSSLHGGGSNSEWLSEQVEITTIDKVSSESGIDYIALLKIDTEGHEIDVLLGATLMIESGKVAAIQFEFGETFLQTNHHFKDIFDILSPRYIVYRVLRSGLVEVPRYHHDLEIYKLANFLCLKRPVEGLEQATL